MAELARQPGMRLTPASAQAGNKAACARAVPYLESIAAPVVAAQS